MRRGSIVRIVVVALLVGVLVSLVAVLIDWLPDPASEEMERIEFVYWFATIICIAIFALVAGSMLYMIVRFRAAPDDDSDGPPIHGHTGLEIAWTLVPVVLVTAIAIVSAVVLARNDDTGERPLRINVTGQQFAWTFEYPEQRNLRVGGELVLPLDRPVKLTLRANDVIHSFWVPNMGQKQDAVPGIETHLVITPNKLGNYPLMCTELCGLGHSVMRASLRVVRPAAFAAWVKEQQGAGGGGQTGAQLFSALGCGGCHAFAPAGTDAEIGPSLDNLEADAKRAGQPLKEYVRQSIVEPSAYIVPGYETPMPAFDTLMDEQLDALVQYLTGGGASQS
jgi:cytochrome c oxidase subunit II